jgi:predicted nucleic acid-binding protein
MEYALIDTGVWYGVFDNRDPRYKDANEKVKYFDFFSFRLLPL